MILSHVQPPVVAQAQALLAPLLLAEPVAATDEARDEALPTPSESLVAQPPTSFRIVPCFTSVRSLVWYSYFLILLGVGIGVLGTFLTIYNLC